jgi:protoporphyrinogen/coproporphyrinogen III oxidase
MRAVVVGGGITGLTAAYYLQEDWPHLSVTLLEASNRLGGVIRTDRVAGFLIESGPESFLARKPHARNLAVRLGLGDDLVGMGPSRGTSVLVGKRLVPLPPSLMGLAPGNWQELFRTRLLSWRGKARAAMDLILPRGKTDGDESVGRFVRRRLGEEMAMRVAGPLFGGIYAGDIDRISLMATLPHLRTMEREHRSLILATGRVGTRPAPAHESPFLTLRSGLGSLVDRLASRLHRVQVMTGAAVTRAGAAHLVLKDGRAVPYDAVLWAVPPRAAAAALRERTAAAAAELAGIPGASTAVVTLAFPASAAGEWTGTGFLVPRGSGTVITGCTWVGNKWPHACPPGWQLARCYVGRSGEEAALHLTDEDLVAAVRSDLRELAGLHAAPALVRVSRWPQAMPQAVVGHLERMAAVEAALPAGHFTAGAGYRGVGLPDCIAQGAAAAHVMGRYLTATATGQASGR